MLRIDRGHLPDGRARREHFDEREAEPLDLILDRAPHGAVGLRDLLVVAEADALDVDGPLQRSQQFADVHRVAFGDGTAAVGSGCALLADQRGGRGLSAGHAVDGVVDEDDGDVFAAIGGVQNLRGADGRQIAVALVADDDALGPAALDGSGYRGSAAVRGLHIADVEVIVGKDRAADGTDEIVLS